MGFLTGVLAAVCWGQTWGGWGARGEGGCLLLIRQVGMRLVGAVCWFTDPHDLSPLCVLIVVDGPGAACASPHVREAPASPPRLYML